MEFLLNTPEDIALDLALKLKELRLLKKWKRSTLAERSGVTEASLRRFEQTGKISLNHFLKLIHALGRLDDATSLLNPPEAGSLKELKQKEKKISKRGSI
jgi:transcriptional regulator with XRE-family HTH domain